MNEYDITIRETLEARQIVADRWKNSEYILDADSFKDVEFYPRGRSRDRGER